MLRHVKFIIVLANEMGPTGQLNEESSARANFAVKLAVRASRATLLTPGWAYRPDSLVRIGDAMKEYILGGLDGKSLNIVSDLESKDTVGDAIYCREYIEEMGMAGSFSLDVVTSDYHCERVLKIFRFVFGELCSVTVHSVRTSNPVSREGSEKLSTEAFNNTFAGIAAGDFKAIKQRLIESHPLYAEGP
jgi:uncharacterized SAM-binding protein YcdF (DUF218 family)